MAITRTAPFALPVELVTDLRLCASGASVTVRGEVDVHTAPVLRRLLRILALTGLDKVLTIRAGSDSAAPA